MKGLISQSGVLRETGRDSINEEWGETLTRISYRKNRAVLSLSVGKSTTAPRVGTRKLSVAVETSNRPRAEPEGGCGHSNGTWSRHRAIRWFGWVALRSPSGRAPGGSGCHRSPLRRCASRTDPGAPAPLVESACRTADTKGEPASC